MSSGFKSESFENSSEGKFMMSRAQVTDVETGSVYDPLGRRGGSGNALSEETSSASVGAEAQTKGGASTVRSPPSKKPAYRN